MTELIDTLRNTFDYVIIDTPPLNLFADAMELLPLSDYNFLIARNKVTKTTHLSASLKLIDSKKIKDISLIFNDIPRDKKMKDYGAYYYTENTEKKKSSRKKIKLKV
jgi:MinD-like ATPase involved in chromosome partitioning or flagellar assembly